MKMYLIDINTVSVFGTLGVTLRSNPTSQGNPKRGIVVAIPIIKRLKMIHLSTQVVETLKYRNNQKFLATNFDHYLV